MANRWLFKTEPTQYSFADLERDGGTRWDGVKNNLALKHLRAVRCGDLAVIYHTGGEKAAVGLARVTSDPYPDPEAGDPRLVVVDIEPLRRLVRPVPLDRIKADPRLRDCELVRLPRLSVLPLSERQWQALAALAGERAGGA
ncbi:MAG: ubiquinol-cytochrome c reductase [Planctomycetota bacterium]|nr:MAG: ubiquinol-cytochrome c reductase [Planctomycetota bacterium]